MAGFFEDLMKMYGSFKREDNLLPINKKIDIFRDVDFADVERRIREIESYTLDLNKIVRVDALPEIPEGYELVARTPFRTVPLPKATEMPDTLALASYANGLRQTLFGQPYVNFTSRDLPTIRVLSEREMERWTQHDGVLGEYSPNTKTLAVLKDEAVMALPAMEPGGGNPWGNDDRLLIATSVRLHELVHWLQFEQSHGDETMWYKDYASMMSMEIEAWTIQAHWLNKHGQYSSAFARLNDVPATVERLYGQYTRDWLAMRERDR